MDRRTGWRGPFWQVLIRLTGFLKHNKRRRNERASVLCIFLGSCLSARRARDVYKEGCLCVIAFVVVVVSWKRRRIRVLCYWIVVEEEGAASQLPVLATITNTHQQQQQEKRKKKKRRKASEQTNRQTYGPWPSSSSSLVMHVRTDGISFRFFSWTQKQTTHKSLFLSLSSLSLLFKLEFCSYRSLHSLSLSFVLLFP